MSLKVTYDAEADAATIFFGAEAGAGEIVRSIPALPRGIAASQVLLNFDAEDRLREVEVLAAASMLPPAVLAEATPL